MQEPVRSWRDRIAGVVRDRVPGGAGFDRLSAAVLASTTLVWPAVAGRLWGPDALVSGIWYRVLRKPAIKPPDAVIPLAWTAIDMALAAAAYRLLRKPSTSDRNEALAWLALNVGLIGGWSAVFFGQRSLAGSTALAAGMVVTGSAYVAAARRVDPPAAAAGVPFVAWVGFATVLTAAIWHRNR